VPRFLSIGHVSRDEFPGGAHRLGGTGLYAAATAARLGVETALVTRVGPNERDEVTRICADLGIDLRILDANVTTTFAFRWDERGTRILTLKARAKGIALRDIPGDLRSADALVFGTIARELSEDLLLGETGRVSVLVAQGLLRMWDADGTVHPTSWDRAEEDIRALNAVVLSEDDVAGDISPVERWSAATRVVLTLAERGCRIYENGHPTAELPAYPPVSMVDTTGAGDTFAAGLAVALGEGRSFPDACSFANAVASFGLEGHGISALASRDAVERRIARA
jgi:sugar/nucleoside kinase (ribokinase family)